MERSKNENELNICLQKCKFNRNMKKNYDGCQCQTDILLELSFHMFSFGSRRPQPSSALCVFSLTYSHAHTTSLGQRGPTHQSTRLECPLYKVRQLTLSTQSHCCHILNQIKPNSNNYPCNSFHKIFSHIGYLKYQQI